MPNILDAYNEAIRICESTNPYARYTQKSTLRGGVIKDGYQWFDCSGFIWRVLKDTGFNVGNYAFTTLGEPTALINAGFIEVDVNGEWRNGDIVWNRKQDSGHTEMVFRGGVGKGITMGAHTSETTIPKQVSVNVRYSTSASYSKLFRYIGGGIDPYQDYEWIIGGSREYLTEEQMQNNAIIVYRYFYSRGWTLNAICGLIGNMEKESTINPRIESSGGGGRGLCGWHTNYLYSIIDVLFGNHNEWYEGYTQCDVIYAQYEEYIGTQHRGIDVEWIPSAQYPIRWEDWATSTDTPFNLAMAFEANYERPASSNTERGDNAEKWYNFLINVDPNGDGGEGRKRSSISVWMMTRKM